jgi:hypothetical protein
MQLLEKIKPGDFITVKDEITLADAVKNNFPNALNGVEFEVKEIDTISESGGLATWTLIKPQIGDMHLLVKKVGELFDVRVVFPLGWMEPDSRAGLIGKDQCWPFSPPEDENNFTPNNLGMSESFVWAIDGKDVAFNKKQNTLFGFSRINPPTTVNKTFTQVTEYLSLESIDCREVIVLEHGGIDAKGIPSNDGGWITVYEGYNIEPQDISVLNK